MGSADSECERSGHRYLTIQLFFIYSKPNSDQSRDAARTTTGPFFNLTNLFQFSIPHCSSLSHSNSLFIPFHSQQLNTLLSLSLSLLLHCTLQLMGNSTSETDQPNQLTDLVINPSANPTPGAVLRDGKEILFQAFNWESHKYNWWETLETKIPDIAKAGITSAWLPPPTHSFAPEGYTPQDLYSLNTKYGSEHQLKALLHKMKQHKVRPMADIVINHRVGTTRGRGGIYNRFDGISLPWDERAVTSSTGGLGKQNTGAIFHGFPNIDHTQDFVRKDIIGWLQFLRHKVGFQDFRFDFAKGYSPKYVKEYIEGAKPVFSVGEYWDTCNYKGSTLDYNQDSHRQRIVNWIDGAGQLSTAFDFTTKGILQEAVKREYWRLCDAQGKPPGVIGWWPSRSATFIDNHDTGSTQAHWPFPSDHVMEGYAYILTHPGIPTIFYDHFYDWNHSVHEQIVKLIDARKRQGIHSRSPIRILEAKHNVYAAVIGEKLCMKIGDGSWSPSGKEWTLSTSGHNYAVWHK